MLGCTLLLLLPLLGVAAFDEDEALLALGILGGRRFGEDDDCSLGEAGDSSLGAPVGRSLHPAFPRAKSSDMEEQPTNSKRKAMETMP